MPVQASSSSRASSPGRDTGLRVFAQASKQGADDGNERRSGTMLLVSWANGEAAAASTSAIVRAPKPNVASVQIDRRGRPAPAWGPGQAAEERQPEEHGCDRSSRDGVRQELGRGEGDSCADLRQEAVEGLVEAQDVDGEPAVRASPTVWAWRGRRR